MDFYNILGNPFTTTQPARGPRRARAVHASSTRHRRRVHPRRPEDGIRLRRRGAHVHQLLHGPRHPGDARCHAAHRQRHVRRSAGRQRRCALNSPLIDTTRLQAFSQEVRLASTGEGTFEWVAGGFYRTWVAATGRACRRRATTPSRGACRHGQRRDYGAPPDNPFFSRLRYNFKQKAVFGEGTSTSTTNGRLTGGVRYYDFEEDRLLTFGGFFAVPQADVPGCRGFERLRAARHPHVRRDRGRAASTRRCPAASASAASTIR